MQKVMINMWLLLLIPFLLTTSSANAISAQTFHSESLALVVVLSNLLHHHVHVTYNKHDVACWQVVYKLEGPTINKQHHGNIHMYIKNNFYLSKLMKTKLFNEQANGQMKHDQTKKKFQVYPPPKKKH